MFSIFGIKKHVFNMHVKLAATQKMPLPSLEEHG